MRLLLLFFALILLNSCIQSGTQTHHSKENSTLQEKRNLSSDFYIISRNDYLDKLHGFWLGQNIANWTGIITEMDKVGDIGDKKTGRFYTRDDWGKADQPNIWTGKVSPISPTIDFVFKEEDEYWDADDDTDIEYIYQHLLNMHQTSFLTGEQIQKGWLKHIKHEEENSLWISNQKALDLMMLGYIPPETSNPDNTSDTLMNVYYDMIDAQLTTEIFGLFAPGRPDLALQMAELPIKTTARENAQWISEFYVVMYSLSAIVDTTKLIKEQVFWLSEIASRQLPNESYSRKMYDFVKRKYEAGLSWEETRDLIYQRYQVDEADGYQMTSKNLLCNGCAAAGINFAASLVSLFYGEGDFQETIKIGTLAGWDSDNPTATWGGLLGFMIGKKEIEKTFKKSFSNKYYIHNTRRNFPNDGMDNFENMALVGVSIVDRVVKDEMLSKVENDQWYIPKRLSN